MDQKGRVALPARYREALVAAGEDKVVVTRSLSDTCLDVFSMKRWEEFEQKVAALPQFDPNVTKLRRLYVSAAVDCELDGQGRILIPPALRQFAKLEKSVFWAGMTHKAELWDEQAWRAVNEAHVIDTALLHSLGAELKL